MYIDIHAHLDHPFIYRRIDEVVDNAKKANVLILSAGIGPRTNRKVIELSKKYDNVKPCLGIYPRDTILKEVEELKKSGRKIDEELVEGEYDLDDELDFIKKEIKKKKIVAIGEVGLDYKLEDSDKKQQIEDFTKIIRLAKKYDVPIIVHTRKAESDTLELLEKEGAKKVVLHCFSGNKKLIEKAIKSGYSFSIPTSVVRSEHFQLLIKMAPINQLFCETDSPYLSPYKDQMNEPANVIESYKKIAEIKKLELKEVENLIYMNYQKMF